MLWFVKEEGEFDVLVWLRFEEQLDFNDPISDSTVLLSEST